MDIVTLLTAHMILIVLVLLFSVAGVTYMLKNNTPRHTKAVKHRQYKETPPHEVYKYRLSSMLAYLGFSTQRFVIKLTEEEIRKHIIRCKTCPSVSVCDRCLRDGETVQNMLFCPNYRSLLACSEIIANQSTE